MYTENQIFCRLFTDNFTKTIADSINPNLWGIWEKSKNIEHFINKINIYDKFNIYYWFFQNVIHFTNASKMEIPDIKSFTLTKQISTELFYHSKDELWRIWIEKANQDPQKFISIINMKYKLCLSLWSQNSLEHISQQLEHTNIH
jgi:hypothetical protein